MIQMWVFVLMIGNDAQAFPTASEERCRSTMEKILMLKRIEGIKASGACYVRATAVDDTERRLIGRPIEGR